MTPSIRGPMSGQISAHTSWAGRPSAHGYLRPSVSRRYASLQKNVSCGPHAIHIANREVRTMLTTVRRLCGQVSGGPPGGPPAARPGWSRQRRDPAPRPAPPSSAGEHVVGALDDLEDLRQLGE